jgi:AhpD family alkylhydroperoxidase
VVATITGHERQAAEGETEPPGVVQRAETGQSRFELTVSQLNGCQYGLAVHATVGKAVGLSPDEIVAARRATATDAKTDAALRFTRALIEEWGHVGDAEVRALESAGFGAGEIVEIIVLVANLVRDSWLTRTFGEDNARQCVVPSSNPIPAGATTPFT